MRYAKKLPWDKPNSLLRAEHGGLQASSSLLHALSRVQFVLLRLGLLQGRGRCVHILLGLFEVDGIDRLEVVDEDRELVGVHAVEAAVGDEGLPLALLLVTEHAPM